MRDPEHFRQVTNTYIEKNKGRDFEGYSDLMTAATDAKFYSLASLMGDVPENAVIVDLGSGTGAVAERMALEFRGSRVYAVDYSHEMLVRMARSRGLLHLVYGDIADQNLPDNSADRIYSSTAFHEVKTFQGIERLRQLFQNVNRQLKPGGYFTARDFVDPERIDPLLMYLPPDGGVGDVVNATSNGLIDYSRLSKRALFEQFQREFQGGNHFVYEKVKIGDVDFYKALPKWIYEFGERKDYTVNWRQEVKEEYGIGTKTFLHNELQQAGFVDIELFDDDSQYIRQFRINGKIFLFEITPKGDLHELPFFPSHMKFRAQKADTGHMFYIPSGNEKPKKENNFDYLKEQITLDKSTGIMQVRDDIFEIDMSQPMHSGSKKNVFWLKSDRPLVLKVIRTDSINGQAALTAMIQAIERQGVLKEYNVPTYQIESIDKAGPPYLFFTQEGVAEQDLCVADLIKAQALTENDIKQIASLVNAFELRGEWQIDTNPYNWYRVTYADGTTELKYVDGKVYLHEETWAFKRIGLMQWLSDKYLSKTEQKTAQIPPADDYKKLSQEWATRSDDLALWWKKYLHPDLQPVPPIE